MQKENNPQKKYLKETFGIKNSFQKKEKQELDVLFLFKGI